jgi:hypothetical protein
MVGSVQQIVLAQFLEIEESFVNLYNYERTWWCKRNDTSREVHEMFKTTDTYTKTRQKVSAMSGVTTGSMLMKLLFEAM